MIKTSISQSVIFGALVAMAMPSLSSSEGHLKQAEALFYEGLFSRAITSATRSLSIEGETAQAYSLRAKAKMMQAIHKSKNFDSALVEDFTRALAVRPDLPLLYDRGFAWIIAGNFSEAAQDFGAVFLAEPDYFRKHDMPYFYWEYRMLHDIHYPFRLNVFVSAKTMLTHAMEYFALGKFPAALRVLHRAHKKGAELDGETLNLIEENILTAQKNFCEISEHDCNVIIGRFFIP